MLFDAGRKKSLEMSAMSQKCQKRHCQLCEILYNGSGKKKMHMTEAGSIFKLSGGEWIKNGELLEYKPRISDPRQMQIKWEHIHRGNEDKTTLKICQMKGCWWRKEHRTSPQIVGHRCLVLQYIFYRFKHAGAQKITLQCVIYVKHLIENVT